MPPQRRPQLAQRRRRVLYSHQCEESQLQVKGRRAESLREARRPATAYGSRVYRRLRARWFGIVPVRRRTMMLVASVVGTVVLLLTAAHAASLGWAPLAYRPEVSRPFRLDRPDSFGTWLGTLLLASAAIVSLMIYQLRRHRTNDYRGHYRLWRPAMIILAIASIDRSMQLGDWLGHMVDEGLGERRAIAGGDWIRLLLVVGGATFGMRIIAEVRHSKLATASLASAAGMLVLPTLARWNIVQLESLWGITFLSAAPLIGSALLWIGLVSYLRMLYRDVRNLDAGDRISDRLQQFRQRLREATQLAPREKPSAESPEERSEKEKQPGRRFSFFQGKKQTSAEGQESAEAREEKKKEKVRVRSVSPQVIEEKDASEKKEEIDDTENRGEGDAKPQRRRWFGGKKSSKTTTAEEDANDLEEYPKPPKGRWFGLKSSAKATPAIAETDEGETSAEPTTPAEATEPRAKRRWLPKISLRLRPRTVDDTIDDNEASSPDAKKPAKNAARPDRTAADHPSADQEEMDEEEYIDPETIDWNALSKSERRRLKRQLKRQDRAA